MIDVIYFRLFEFRKASSYESSISLVHLALTLCSNCIKYNAGFSRAGYSREYNNFVFRYGKRYMLQVILIQSSNHYAVLFFHL